MRWRAASWPRGLREGALAVVLALGVLGLASLNPALLRGLETSSLDLRFRLRGAQADPTHTAVILVDDRSLAALGRWPLSRRLYAKALQLLDQAGARVIAFDLLFAEPEQPLSGECARGDPGSGRRSAAGAGISREAGSDAPRGGRPGRRFRGSAEGERQGVAAGRFRFSGQGRATSRRSWPIRSTSGSTRASTSRSFRCSQNHRCCRCRRWPRRRTASAMSALPSIATARRGTTTSHCRSVAILSPSLPVRAVAAYRGVKWSDVGLALGDGIHLGDQFVPTDPAMRLLIDYRGPRGTDPDLFVCRSGRRARCRRTNSRDVSCLSARRLSAVADSYPGPFDSTPIPGTERLAEIIETLLSGHFIGENPPPWPTLIIAGVGVLALSIGVAGALLPTSLVGLGVAVPIAIWAGGAQLAFQHGLWLPVVDAARGAADRDGRRDAVPLWFRQPAAAADPGGVPALPGA